MDPELLLGSAILQDFPNDYHAGVVPSPGRKRNEVAWVDIAP